MCILQIILLLVHGDVGDIGDIHQAERPANDSKKIRISPSLSLSRFLLLMQMNIALENQHPVRRVSLISQIKPRNEI